MRPSISYGISPSFDKYYDSYEVVSADGLTTSDIEYSDLKGQFLVYQIKTMQAQLLYH